MTYVRLAMWEQTEVPLGWTYYTPYERKKVASSARMPEMCVAGKMIFFSELAFFTPRDSNSLAPIHTRRCLEGHYKLSEAL